MDDRTLYRLAVEKFSQRSLARAVKTPALMLVFFAVPVLLATAAPPWWLLLLVAYLLFGLFQYYALIATHEAIHYGLWPQKQINDRLGWLCACIHSFNFAEIKKAHLEHHRILGDPNDPDYPSYIKEQPGTHFSLTATFLRPFQSILAALGLSKPPPASEIEDTGSGAKLQYSPRKDAWKIALFHLLVVALLGLLSPLLSLGWILALGTIPGFLMHIRLITEHGDMVFKNQPLGDRRMVARTHTPPPRAADRAVFEAVRFVIAPFNFNYHHEHHSMASIPYYNLPDTHGFLYREGYYADKSAQLSDSYPATFRRNFSL